MEEKMKDIKVSVIMPVYNAAEYLSRTLDDVTNQTLRDIQIICVDDGSKDNSREIVKEYQKKDERIQLVEQENKNAGAARNHGMQYAKGKYVVFWDSDDLFFHCRQGRRGQIPHWAGAETAHGRCRQQRQRPESGEQPLCPCRSGAPLADDR